MRFAAGDAEEQAIVMGLMNAIGYTVYTWLLLLVRAGISSAEIYKRVCLKLLSLSCAGWDYGLVALL